MKAHRLLIPLFLFLVIFPSRQGAGYELPKDFYRYLATMGRVIDGNTISVDIDLGFGIWFHETEIRLKGVKTPPMEGETLKKGVAAAKFLQEKLKDQERILLHTAYDPTGEIHRLARRSLDLGRRQ